ncbi:MAG TPA: MGMT family protein [Candidatus Dormibacteraeota bacterium]|nr:MGMT family protein [Candidatus Dormibacteraeota bacterium]
MSWTPVYRIVQQIPRGQVLTYGGLARLLRLRGGARTAGRAMAATPRGQGIPWHRVVGGGGRILLREPYASLQRRLLETEGVAVLERRINLSKHLWKPRSSFLTRKTFKPKAPKSSLRKTKPRQPRPRKPSPVKPSIVL